jgi:hypothetical protein
MSRWGTVSHPNSVLRGRATVLSGDTQINIAFLWLAHDILLVFRAYSYYYPDTKTPIQIEQSGVQSLDAHKVLKSTDTVLNTGLKDVPSMKRHHSLDTYRICYRRLPGILLPALPASSNSPKHKNDQDLLYVVGSCCTIHSRLRRSLNNPCFYSSVLHPFQLRVPCMYRCTPPQLVTGEGHPVRCCAVQSLST